MPRQFTYEEWKEFQASGQKLPGWGCFEPIGEWPKNTGGIDMEEEIKRVLSQEIK